MSWMIPTWWQATTTMQLVRLWASTLPRTFPRMMSVSFTSWMWTALITPKEALSCELRRSTIQWERDDIVSVKPSEVSRGIEEVVKNVDVAGPKVISEVDEAVRLADVVASWRVSLAKSLFRGLTLLLGVSIILSFRCSGLERGVAIAVRSRFLNANFPFDEEAWVCKDFRRVSSSCNC